MKKNKLLNLFLPLKLGLFLMILCITLPSANAFAEEKSKKKKKKKPEFALQFKLATIYDDNILKYSEKYLERFMNGEDKGRFHIDTYDDVIFYTSLGGTVTHKIFGKQKSVLNAEAARRTYAVNDIKSWNYFAIGFRQYINKKLSFKISYSYIPDFYVRHFRDDQWIAIYGYTSEAFTPYAFAKDNFGLWGQNTFFKNTRVRLSLYYAPYYHNQHYTEYDSKNWTYGFQIYQPLHKNFRIDAEYQYVTSDAKGYDASYQTPETTLGPDATYVEDRFTFGFLWTLPKIKKIRHSFEAKSLFFNRFYSSPYPWQIDELHAGRVDKNIRLYFNYEVRLNKNLNITAYYNWFGRDSYTASEGNSEFVSNEKDYKQNIIGLELSYKLKL
jgi:hypothetical protein